MTDNTQIDPSEFRIQVGIADSPLEPLIDVLGTDAENEKALELVQEGSDEVSYITINGGIWAYAETDEKTVEGPAERDNIVAGLARADSVRVVDYDSTPMTGTIRNQS